MADPGNPSEFSPAELDRLEDALEQWTGDAFESVPEDSSLPAPLRARLGEYRDILALSREALAPEDVPDGLLDSVLAEAHASAAAAPHVPPLHRPPAGPGLWERLRRSLLLPGVALAGSTVMLLWLVQPREDANEMLVERGTPGAIQAESLAPARLTPGDGPAPAGPAPAEPTPAAAASAASASADEAEEAAKSEGPAMADAPGATAPSLGAAGQADERKDRDDLKLEPKAKRPSKEDVEAPIEVLPGLGDVPTQDADKEALRDTLEQADKLRRAGRCDAAMALYMEAFGMSGPLGEQARARAGYGLCLASQGDDGKADKYFEDAQRRSPGVVSWISRERGEGAATKKSKASKPSPARSKTAEPFK